MSYSTIDCGGMADTWEETVIQLWNPGDEPERGYMRVGKFLAIYDRVAKDVPVSDTAELRFEYVPRISQPLAIMSNVWILAVQS